MSGKQGWIFNISPCKFFYSSTGTSTGTVIVSQIFSLAVRNWAGIFVTLYKHHGDFLPPGIGNRRYPTVGMIPGIVLPTKHLFHIRKDVHIDIARYVPWCTQLKLRHNAPLPCTAWDNILRSRIFSIYPAEPSSLRCSITTYPLIIWLKIIVTQGESPNLTRRFSVVRSTSTHRNTRGSWQCTSNRAWSQWHLSSRCSSSESLSRSLP